MEKMLKEVVQYWDSLVCVVWVWVLSGNLYFLAGQ